MYKTYRKSMVVIVMVILLLFLGLDFGTEKVEAATAYGTNLVINGNGEASGIITDYPGSTNYAGWTSVSLERSETTAFIVGDSIILSQPASPNGGNFFEFYPLSEASDTLYQTIDISDIFTDVDSGYIVCDLKGYLKKLKAASSATIVLDMLDSSDKVLSSYQLTEDSADDSDDWVYKTRSNIPVDINTRKFRISLNASISNVSPDSDYIEFDGIELILRNVPAINVKGNNINIVNNDYIPDITDHTDFGSTDITSGSVTRTFVIENNGAGALLLYGASKVAISGTNASDFTVTTGPSSSVNAGETTAFDITFNPSAVGVRKAIIVIENSSFQDPYVYYIKGTGTEATDIQNITAANVQITAPVLGADPQYAEAVQVATNNADFTVTDLTWNEPLTTGGKFKAGQVYTATVTLTSKNDKRFQSEAFTPTVAGSASVGMTTTSGEAVGNTVSFTVTYAATGELVVSSIAVTTQPTKMSYVETTDGLLALNGMQITETNNDGSTRNVSFTDGTATEYTSNPANGTELTNAAHNGHPVTITHTVSGKTANTNNLTVGEYVPSVPVTNYDVWVGGIQVTSANMGDVLGAADVGATVTYTPATGSTPQTLSLSGADITGAYTEVHESYGNQNYTIYAKAILNIVLTGDNTVTGKGPKDSYGIYTTGALTISGTGSLTTSGASGKDIDMSYGIRSNGNITITSGTVTASGGDSKYQSRGIAGSNVTISGGTVSATAGDSIYSFGLDGSYIIISGGTVSASGKVGTTGYINLSGGTVTISGNNNAVRELDDLVYSNGIVSASINSDGSAAGPYNSADKKLYKYIYYKPASPLTGTVTISGEPKYGQTLTSTYNHGNSTGTLSYQWKSNGSDTGSDSNTYTLVAADIGKKITCKVTSTEQTGSVTSVATKVIEKADGQLVTGVSSVGCTTIGNNNGQLIGVTTAMEYRSSSTETYTTGTGSDVTGLTNGNYYVRMKETTTHKAGNYSVFSVEQYVPLVTVPGAPTIGTATAGNGQATVAFIPPASDGGAEITLYTVTANPGGNTGTGVASPIIVTGLTNGTAYTFTVTATNSLGTSVASGPSNGVIPSLPSYTITYRPGTNGSGSVSTDYKIHAAGIGLRGVTFTRTGYTQTGWATSDGGAKSYELEAIYSVDAAIDLYPVWTIIDLPDPDIAIIDNAKIAAYNAIYFNMTQVSTVNGAAISNALKATAEAAVNNSSVTTTINGIGYTVPVAGTSANPNGTNGTYTFTVTVAKGVQSRTTEQRSITIVATPFTDATDTDAVEAAKAAIVNGTVNVAYGADQSAKTAAVQTYVNSLINSTVATTGVTGTVTYSSGNTYSVTISKGSVSDTKIISMTVNEAPNPSPAPTPDPSPNPTPSPVERPEGKIEKDKQQDEGAPVANVNNSSDELKTSVLTPDEQELVAKGENAKIILKVTDISSSINEEEKKLIQDKLVAENRKEEKEADENVASDIAILYVDLTLYKRVGSGEQTKVTETNEKISISLEIPEEFWNTDVTKSREFYVMRIHDGEITRIDGSYDAIKQIFTFETDRFSTYALAYQDTSRIKTYEGFRYLQLRVKSDKTSQTLSYKRIGTIDGYLIFGGKCGEEMVELADLPAKTTSYVIEDRIPRTFYKYQIKAYRVIDGEKMIIMTSKVVHSIVNGKSYADPTRVTLDMTSIKLTKGENKAITGQVVLPKGKKLKDHTTVIRFESSNSEIASVNNKGIITGKAEGTCYVYAYAQNGVYKRIKVTVK